MGALEATFFAQSTRNLVRMFVLIKSRISLNLGHLGSKTRSLGQIKEIPCGRSRGPISHSVDLKIGQNVCLDENSDECEFGLPDIKN